MARKKKKRVASRGSVNNIILKTLINGDKYGYEIIKEVEELSQGKIQLKQPSLYSSLSRFEDKKYVTSYWGDSDIGGRRHYYHLTELGMQYYRKSVLKESDYETYELDDEEIKEIMEENISSQDKILDNSQNIVFDEDNDDDEDEKLDLEDSEMNSQFVELSNDDIPAIVNFEKRDESEEVIIPDHQFFKSTPIENILSNENSHSTTLQNNDIEIQTNIDNIEHSKNEEIIEELTWQQLANSVKQSNAKISQTKFDKLYFKKPKAVQKVILDVDGIYKLRDENYHPIINESKPVIIDNVGKRTTPVNVYGYSTYVDNTPQQKSYAELTDEEKRKRNENFLAKFNLLTNSKMKPISTPTPKVEERKPEKPIDYRGKLDKIIENNSYNNGYTQQQEQSIQENNLFNYTDDNWNTYEKTSPTPIFEEEEDKFVELEPVEHFETKSDDKEYIEEINNYSAPTTQVKINKYEHKTNAVLNDRTFILLNKLKFVFGIILTLLLLAELTISYFIFKNNNLIFENDRTIFIIGYCITALLAGIYILPFIIDKNVHKPNNFKFSHALWYGLLTFLVSIVLIYCFNALNGFELDNFKFFAVKIIVPIVLCFNFVIGPIIYGLLVKNKAFYD